LQVIGNLLPTPARRFFLFLTQIVNMFRKGDARARSGEANPCTSTAEHVQRGDQKQKICNEKQLWWPPPPDNALKVLL
jgi:hypothetical protein